MFYTVWKPEILSKFFSSMNHCSNCQNFLNMESLIFIFSVCSGKFSESNSQIFISMLTERTICRRGLSKRSLTEVQLYRLLYVILSSTNVLRNPDVFDVSGFFWRYREQITRNQRDLTLLWPNLSFTKLRIGCDKKKKATLSVKMANKKPSLQKI